jgi:hypothetical protein
VGVGVVVIVGVVLAVTLAKGNGSDGSTHSAGSSSGASAAQPFGRDDLLQAVCKPGSWANGTGHLRNADGQGQCQALHGTRTYGLLAIGQYSSSYEANNDAQFLHNLVSKAPYALGTDPGGTTWLVIPLIGGDDSTLEPLTQFGFQIKAAGAS